MILLKVCSAKSGSGKTRTTLKVPEVEQFWHENVQLSANHTQLLPVKIENSIASATVGTLFLYCVRVVNQYTRALCTACVLLFLRKVTCTYLSGT